MNLRKCLGVGAVLCGAGFACAEPPSVLADLSNVKITSHVFYNLDTGEMVIKPYEGHQPRETPFWGGSSWGTSATGALIVDDPARPVSDPHAGFGSEIVAWGDAPFGSSVQHFDFAYITDIPGPGPGEPVDGFSIAVRVYQNDNGGNDSHAIVIREGRTPSMPGKEFTGPGYTGVAVTISMVTLEPLFELNRSAGAIDRDGDGLADFSIGISFVQDQATKGQTGLFLAQPASLGGPGTATGVEDALDWFNEVARGDFRGTFDMGGGVPGVTPFAAVFLDLYGTAGAMCDVIDYNNDDVIDFGDYLEFLTAFDTGTLTADLNGDGVVDFGDYLVFLNLFDNCG